MLLPCLDGLDHDWEGRLCCRRCWLGKSAPSKAPSAQPFGKDKEAVKVYLERRDGEGCFYCKEKFDRYVLDHHIPRSKGGADGLWNRRLACLECDRQKGSLMPDQFLSSSRTFPPPV